MTALGMILNSMGIKITDEQRAQIEILIPQIPSRVVQCVEVINASIAKVNENTASIQNLVTEVSSLRDVVKEARQEMETCCAEFRTFLQEMKENGRRNNDTDSPTGTEPDSGGRYLPGNPSKRRRAPNGAA